MITSKNIKKAAHEQLEKGNNVLIIYRNEEYMKFRPDDYSMMRLALRCEGVGSCRGQYIYVDSEKVITKPRLMLSLMDTMIEKDFQLPLFSGARIQV